MLNKLKKRLEKARDNYNKHVDRCPICSEFSNDLCNRGKNLEAEEIRLARLIEKSNK